MGFLRVAAVVVLSFLLFIFLAASNAMFILGTSLSYGNVNASLSPFVNQVSNAVASNSIPPELTQNINISQYVQDATNQARSYCQSNPDYSYNFSYGGYNVNIPCSSINFSAPNPAGQVAAQSLNSVVYDSYYYNYGCSFIQCFSQISPPTFLVSEMSYKYMMGKFYLALIISAILVALLLLAALRKANGLIIIGSLLVVSSIAVSGAIKILLSMLGQYGQIAAAFLAAAKTAFWLPIILGAVVLCTGIGFRIWGKKPEAKTKDKSKKPA